VQDKLFPGIPQSKFLKQLHSTGYKSSYQEHANEKDAFDDDHSDIDWNVTNLEEAGIPIFLERSHKRIDGISPADIAQSISACMRQNSIMAEYDNDKGIAYAQCHNVKFRVYLYKATQSSDRDCISGNHVIVEVQRRSGCCVKFHTIANQILCAAKGSVYNIPSCPFGEIPENVKKSLKWNHSDEDSQSCNCSFWKYNIHDADCDSALGNKNSVF
jgi:hypothetical protein